MPTLVTCFKAASESVEPIVGDYINAVKAHETVRSCLEENSTLKAMEVDTCLIGSYKRNTAIRRVKDVDVFTKLPVIDAALTANEVTELVRSVLIDKFGRDAVDPQDRSTLVSFNSFDLTVDVVLARPVNKWWEIPDGTGGWLETNPEAMTNITTAMNARYGDLYVPVVKLIRQTRRNLLGKSRPGGYLFEVLAYHAFDGGIKGGDRGTLYTSALTHVATSLSNRSYGVSITDPTMPRQSILIRATDDEWRNAASIFADAASQASTALASTDDCAAAKTFRNLLGKNSAGNWVFEMPALCNEDGTKKSFNVASAGSAEVPAGAGRFA